MSLATPADPDATVEAARDAYLAENGFTVEQYTQPSFEVPFGRWVLRLPNPPARQRAVCLHDLHHVVTGYGTDPLGEMEVSAFEVAGGLGGLWIAWMLSVPFFLFGLVRHPRRTWRAYRSARSCRSLLGDPRPYTELLGATVAELRESLGPPRTGAAEHPAGLNHLAPVVRDV